MIIFKNVLKPALKKTLTKNCPRFTTHFQLWKIAHTCGSDVGECQITSMNMVGLISICQSLSFINGQEVPCATDCLTTMAKLKSETNNLEKRLDLMEIASSTNYSLNTICDSR